MDRSESPPISVEPALACCGDFREVSSAFSIGGVAVRLTGKSLPDVALNPSLQPYRAQSCRADVDIRVEWVTRILPSSCRKTFDSGTTWELHESSSQLQFDLRSKTLGSHPYARLTIDDLFRQGTLQMSEDCFARLGYPAEPLEYPLDELLIMHRLTQERAIELHGTGIVRANGVANLFVGHSGAGKSTTTRLWTAREDVEVLSDDRIIVRRDDDRSEVETPFGAAGAAGERGVLRLRDRSASPNGHFAQDDKKKMKMRMYGTPWHGEAAYASPGSAPLARIFILEHGRGNVLTRLSPSQAVAELFARSFVPFHRYEYVSSALEFLQEMVDAVPCYRYAFEPNEAAVERILEFRD